MIYSLRFTTIDTARPWLITIGNNVKITKGVTILTHGYDWSVLRYTKEMMIGSSGKVKIGNNVIVGDNPAKVIMTIDEYFEKRQQEYIYEVKEMSVGYFKRYKEIPSISIFKEFFLYFYQEIIKIY